MRIQNIKKTFILIYQVDMYVIINIPPVNGYSHKVLDCKRVLILSSHTHLSSPCLSSLSVHNLSVWMLFLFIQCISTYLEYNFGNQLANKYCICRIPLDLKLLWYWYFAILYIWSFYLASRRNHALSNILHIYHRTGY